MEVQIVAPGASHAVLLGRGGREGKKLWEEDSYAHPAGRGDEGFGAGPRSGEEGARAARAREKF